MGAISYRQKQAQKTKQLIFQTALALFKEKGFENVSVEDIVRTAQVSRGSFYTYFKNKEDLLGNYVHQNDVFYLAFYQDVLCAPEAGGLDAMEKIERFLWYAVENLTSVGAHLLHLYNVYLVKTPDIYSRRDRYFFTILRELFQKAQEERSVSEKISYESFQEIALWTVRGITIDWAGNGGAYPIEQTRPILSEFIRCLRTQA